jgi:hypothetical protein
MGVEGQAATGCGARSDWQAERRLRRRGAFRRGAWQEQVGSLVAWALGLYLGELSH